MANQHRRSKKTRRQQQRTHSPGKTNEAPAVIPVVVTQRGKKTQDQVEQAQGPPGGKDSWWKGWWARLLAKLLGFLITSYLIFLGVQAQWGETKSGERARVIPKGVTMAAPLTFHREMDTAFTMKLTLGNIGLSTGINVGIVVDVVFVKGKTTTEDIERVRNEMCDLVRQNRGRIVKTPPLFQGQEDTRTIEIRIIKEIVQDGIITLPSGPQETIYPVLVGCVGYQSPLDSERHGFGLAYSVLSNNDAVRRKFILEETVPAEQITFQSLPIIKDYEY